MTPHRICLFGAGEMASTHAMNLRADPRVQLAYVVDPSAERAGHLAAATGARVVDPDTAFADPDIAAYIIASPPRTHADYLDRAALTGAHVFCEKPIDHDIARARASLAALKGREGFVQMGFNRRFDPQFMALKSALVAGRIGTPEQVLIVSRDAEAPPVEGFLHSSGLIKETAVHDFDLIRWLLEDEVAEVYVMADALINPDYVSVGQVDTTTTTLRMRRGTHVTVLNSLRAAFGYDQRLEVLGSLGQAAVGNVAASHLVLSTTDGIQSAKPWFSYFQRYADAYRAEILQFAEAVVTGARVTPDALDGLRASEIAEAVLLSQKDRRPVRL
jgi:myo-inositol 2-dehydrogenase / D-chiro-inositol 1-dehydrogenase